MSTLLLSLPVTPGLDQPVACAAPLPAPRHRRLRLHGWVRAEVVVEPGDLRAFDAMRVDDFRVSCTFGGDHGGVRPMRAVALRDLLALVVPAFDARTDFKRTVLVAEGRDGYRAVFSWNELHNTPVGAGVVVAFDDDGHPLPDDTGPFALVSRLDEVSGPRFVRGLTGIELRRLW